MALNYNSKLKDLLDNPQTLEVLEKHLPGISTNPDSKKAYGMTMKAICAFPALKVPKEVAQALEADLNALGL